MKLFFAILSVLLFGFLSFHVIAQEEGDIETQELIELEGDEGYNVSELLGS